MQYIKPAACLSPLQTKWIHLVLQQPAGVKPWHPPYTLPCHYPAVFLLHFSHPIPIGLAQSLCLARSRSVGYLCKLHKNVRKHDKKNMIQIFSHPYWEANWTLGMQEGGKAKRELQSREQPKKRLKHGTFLPCMVILELLYSSGQH